MRRRLAALAAIAALWSLLSPAAAEPVRGAGSTFAYPAIARWSQSFQAALKGEDFVSTESGVDYEPVGSLAGTMRLAQPEVDFAATDVPLPADDLKRFDLVQFPLVMGGVAVAANLPGIGRDSLRLDARTLAGIFSGRITAWNDPAVAAVNPGAMLPALSIRVVTRSDGSGTTLNFTRYLAQRDAEWKRTISSDTLVKFPVGESREGTGRVLRHVQDTPGAVAYVEYGQARRTNLAIAAIENGAGRFVAPSAASLQAAALNADWAASPGFALFLTDAPGADTYPLAATTFAQMHRSGRSAARVRRALLFFEHALDAGGPSAAELGYVPLPAPLVRQVKDSWNAAFAAQRRF